MVGAQDLFKVKIRIAGGDGGAVLATEGNFCVIVWKRIGIRQRGEGTEDCQIGAATAVKADQIGFPVDLVGDPAVAVAGRIAADGIFQPLPDPELPVVLEGVAEQVPVAAAGGAADKKGVAEGIDPEKPLELAHQLLGDGMGVQRIRPGGQGLEAGIGGEDAQHHVVYIGKVVLNLSSRIGQGPLIGGGDLFIGVKSAV